MSVLSLLLLLGSFRGTAAVASTRHRATFADGAEIKAPPSWGGGLDAAVASVLGSDTAAQYFSDFEPEHPEASLYRLGPVSGLDGFRVTHDGACRASPTSVSAVSAKTSQI